MKKNKLFTSLIIPSCVVLSIIPFVVSCGSVGPEPGPGPIPVPTPTPDKYLVWDFVNGKNDEIAIKSYNPQTIPCEIVIPEQLPIEGNNYPVTLIDTAAFYSCQNITKVTLPSTLVEIESAAFIYCQCLKEITIPNSVQTLGEGAFEFCSQLTKVVFSENLKNIPQETFYECEKLKDIKLPSTIESIGGSAFRGCKSLTSIAIPHTLEEIKYQAFYYCPNLTEIDLTDWGTDKYSSGWDEDIFNTCPSTEGVIWFKTGCEVIGYWKNKLYNAGIDFINDNWQFKEKN